MPRRPLANHNQRTQSSTPRLTNNCASVMPEHWRLHVSAQLRKYVRSGRPTRRPGSRHPGARPAAARNTRPDAGGGQGPAPRRPRPTRQHADRRGLVERPTSHIGAGRTLGLDQVLAVRADDDVDDAAPLDVVKSGVADAPSLAWEPVERGGDLVALVVPLGDPPPASGSIKSEYSSGGFRLLT
jgi:hypothetical protein